MSALLQAALDAAALPFPPGVEIGLHPCRGKAALVPGWPDAATTDPDQIRNWWRTYPAANPALAIRAGLAVLDVDPRHGGDSSLAALEAECGPLPASWRVATGGGGVHLYFTIPAGLPLKNRAGALGPGLDLKTAGGYVLAPGSVHPETGRAYDWQPGYAPEDGPIAIMPWPLIAKLIAPAPATGVDTMSTPVTPPTNGHRAPADKLLEWALDRAVGNRNDRGAELARQCRDNGYTQPETEDILREYQRRAPGGDHPYTLSEALASARSAFNRPAREPWTPAANTSQPAEPEPRLNEVPGDCDDLRTAIAALRAENAALKADRRRLRDFALNRGVDDRTFRTHIVLGFRLAETADGEPARLATKWIAADLGMSEVRAAALLTDAAERGLIVRERVIETREIPDRETGELKKRGAVIYHHGYADDVVDFGGHIAAVDASYAEKPLSRPGGKRERGDPRTCPGCGEIALETHSYGHCRHCHRRFKDGTELGGARVYVHPLAEVPDPAEWNDQVDHSTRTDDAPDAASNPHADKVLVHGQVDQFTPAPAADPPFGHRMHCLSSHGGRSVPFWRASWGTDLCSACHPPPPT